MNTETKIAIGAAICAMLPLALGEWAHRRAVASMEAPMELVWSHQGGTALAATLELAPERTSISVKREASHSFLPEYERRLVVRSVGRKELVFPMFPDTGGTVRINAYRLGPGAILLVDRIGAYQIDLAEFRVKEVKQEALPVGASFLGSFDQLGTNWQFIGVEEREEMPL